MSKNEKNVLKGKMNFEAILEEKHVEISFTIIKTLL